MTDFVSLIFTGELSGVDSTGILRQGVIYIKVSKNHSIYLAGHVSISYEIFVSRGLFRFI